MPQAWTEHGGHGHVDVGRGDIALAVIGTKTRHDPIGMEYDLAMRDNSPDSIQTQDQSQDVAHYNKNQNLIL